MADDTPCCWRWCMKDSRFPAVMRMGKRWWTLWLCGGAGRVATAGLARFWRYDAAMVRRRSVAAARRGRKAEHQMAGTML